MTSIFANMDYLFWRLPAEHQDGTFPWIFWYIWKSRNGKVFQNLDRNPQDILQLAEQDAVICEAAQEVPQPSVHESKFFVPTNPENLEYVCHTDGSWKDTYLFSDFGWHYLRGDGEESLVGART